MPPTAGWRGPTKEANSSHPDPPVSIPNRHKTARGTYRWISYPQGARLPRLHAPQRSLVELMDLWRKCLERLEREIPLEEVNTWIRPLRFEDGGAAGYRLMAPNDFVREQVSSHYLERIRDLFEHFGYNREAISINVGQTAAPDAAPARPRTRHDDRTAGLDSRYHFDNFVLGKSNELACAATRQVAQNPGKVYNPLLLYGGTGLGKTHLLHAAGRLIAQRDTDARILYLHSEKFVSEMIQALRRDNIDQFKKRYRTVDALLIDDIQFFAGKDRSQEEFFHTFNSLLEAQQQIILTCDRYPKEVEGIEARLRSRFGWGLTVSIEPPDFETRVAILLKKAAEREVELNQDVAYLIAKRMRSNVRDLEGALNSLIANARFSNQAIDLEFCQETLKDLLAVHDRLITVENIQKTVADYYKLKVTDMLSKRRTRSIARPRQLAMALSKQLTEHSLPEIGEAFGGRDHTTVLHACRKIESLCETDGRLNEDRVRLLRTLTT